MLELSLLRRTAVAAVAGSLALAAPALADPVKAGPAVPNELAVVTSDGVGTSAATLPFALDRIATGDGGYKGRIAFPSTGDSAQTVPVPSGPSGVQVVRSVDGRSLTVAAANVAAGTSAAGAANAWDVVSVKSDGTSTSVPVGPSASTVPLLGAATVDGSRFWFVRNTSTGTFGTVAPGDAAATTLSGSLNASPYTVQIADGNLYTSTAGGVYRVAGGGLPTSASSAAPEQVLNSHATRDSAFVDTDGDGASDALYVAFGGYGADPAGLYKYVLSGGTWVAAGSWRGSYYWIAARAVAGAVEIYSVDSSGTYVQKTVDTADSGAALETTGPTTLATAPGGARYSGLAFEPGSGFPADSTPYPPAPPRITATNTSAYPPVGSALTTSVDVTVSDVNTPASDLKVTGASSNQKALPDDHITVSGTGATRSVAFDPIAAGRATVTVTVTDGDGSTATTTVSVNAQAAAPDPTGQYFTGPDLSGDVDLGGDYFLAASDESIGVAGLFKKGDSTNAITGGGGAVGTNTGSKELDIESGTRIGDTDMTVWSGSHANSRQGASKPERQYLGFAKIIGSGASTKLLPLGSYTRLLTQWKAWDAANGHGLGANFLKLNTATPAGVLPNAPDGWNIEGLTMAPHSDHVGWFGLRAPTVTGPNGLEDAVILPVDNLDELAQGNSVDAQLGKPILLNLGGRSIRDIAKNANDQYLISAGPGDDATKSIQNWALYEWDGNPDHDPQMVKLLPNDPTHIGAWEGIASLPDSLTAGSSVLLTADSGDSVLASQNLTYGQYVTLDAPIAGPAAPHVTATANTGAIDLSWDKVDGATGYFVSVKDADGKDVPGTPFVTTDTSRTLEPLTGGSEYTVVVSSQNDVTRTPSAPVKISPTQGPRTAVTVDVGVTGVGILGQPTQLVATLSDPNARGTIVFYAGQTKLGPRGAQDVPVVDGKATLDITTSGYVRPGGQAIRAVYTSANTELDASAETTKTLVVDYRPQQAALDLVSIDGARVAGQPLTLTFRVRGYTADQLYPGGRLLLQVYARENGATTETQIGGTYFDPATGVATVTVAGSALPAGTHRISGFVGNFAATMTSIVSDEIPVTIAPAGTTPPPLPTITHPKVFLSISGPRRLDQPFTLTARVSDPTLKGTVQFLQDADYSMGGPVPVVDGIATEQVSSLRALTTPQIHARFEPADDRDTTASANSLVLAPVLGSVMDPPAPKTPTTTTLAVDGDDVSGHPLTGTVRVAPTTDEPFAALNIKGYVELTDNGTTVDLEHLVAGKAAFDLSALGAGVHSLVAHYVSSDETRATDSRSAATPVTITAQTQTQGDVTGTVPATLSLTLGAPATLGDFTPGLEKSYTANTTANVISTAGDAALTVGGPGHLTNGTFSLPQPLGVNLSKSAWTGPVSNDPVDITFTQAIGANDALRTGTYSTTLTFTLSTTTP